MCSGNGMGVEFDEDTLSISEYIPELINKENVDFHQYKFLKKSEKHALDVLVIITKLFTHSPLIVILLNTARDSIIALNDTRRELYQLKIDKKYEHHRSMCEALRTDYEITDEQISKEAIELWNKENESNGKL